MAKGKLVKRSWAELPHEAISYVRSLTRYLCDLLLRCEALPDVRAWPYFVPYNRLVAETIVSKEPTTYPPIWSTNARHAGHRHVWAVLVQAQILSNLQNVCREWEAARTFYSSIKRPVDHR